MKQVFTIPGRMLGRNEREELARAHWSKAAREKKRETENAMAYITAAGIKPVDGPVDIAIVFNEHVGLYKSGKRKHVRDVDNITDAQKPILDALVKKKIVVDDGPDYVKRVIPVVKYTTGDPYIKVLIMDYEPRRRVTYAPVEVPGKGG